MWCSESAKEPNLKSPKGWLRQIFIPYHSISVSHFGWHDDFQIHCKVAVLRSCGICLSGSKVRSHQTWWPDLVLSEVLLFQDPQKTLERHTEVDIKTMGTWDDDHTVQAGLLGCIFEENSCKMLQGSKSNGLEIPQGSKVHVNRIKHCPKKVLRQNSSRKMLWGSPTLTMCAANSH